MKIVKFILFSLFDGLASSSGSRSFYLTGWKSLIFGLIFFFVIVTIFTLFNIFVFKNKKLGELWSALCTLGIILIFFLLCIIFELLFL